MIGYVWIIIGLSWAAALTLGWLWRGEARRAGGLEADKARLENDKRKLEETITRLQEAGDVRPPSYLAGLQRLSQAGRAGDYVDLPASDLAE